LRSTLEEAAAKQTSICVSRRPSLGASGNVYGLFAVSTFLSPFSTMSIIFLPFVAFKSYQFMAVFVSLDLLGLIFNRKVSARSPRDALSNSRCAGVVHRPRRCVCAFAHRTPLNAFRVRSFGRLLWRFDDGLAFLFGARRATTKKKAQRGQTN
jgi:hypothetical protein